MPTVKANRKTDGTTTKKAAKTAKKPAQKVTMDDIWAGFDRFQKGMDEIREAHEKGMDEIREAHKELEKAQAETVKALREANSLTEKTLREANGLTEKTLNKAIGGLSNTVGSLIEHVMTAGLPQKFKRLGFTFDRVTTVKWADGENNLYTEIDGLLENGNQAMAVEVKTTLRNEDVEDHLKRMEKVRKYADLHGDKREFLSAIATAIISKSSKEYALNKGLFVIEPAGEDVKITKPVSAKVW
jgi:vacuolar-type H+-ATPase subunit H